MASIWATDEQLLAVMLACENFQAHWRQFRQMPFQPLFKGGVDDIEALDYLEDEGLSFPRVGDDAATLVWGNVLARQVGFEWVCSIRGDLLLAWVGPSGFKSGCGAVWPFARVLEAQVGGSPQFDRFNWLTRRVIAGCLADCDNSELAARLHQFKDRMDAG